MVRIKTRPLEGQAVQWTGWNEKEIESLFMRHNPTEPVTLVPVTTETGVRTLELYFLDHLDATDFVYPVGTWFVSMNVGIMHSHVMVVPERVFVETYEVVE